MSSVSTPASRSAIGVRYGLFFHKSGTLVRTSVTNRPGWAACRSRTAAVNMTTSPGLWKDVNSNRFIGGISVGDSARDHVRSRHAPQARSRHTNALHTTNSGPSTKNRERNRSERSGETNLAPEDESTVRTELSWSAKIVAGHLQEVKRLSRKMISESAVKSYDG